MSKLYKKKYILLYIYILLCYLYINDKKVKKKIEEYMQI